MSFKNRREWLFLYSVKDANPNGDPLNANHPRYDEEAGQILVSDVRKKRTIRDQWVRDGELIFVDGLPKTLEERLKEIKEQVQKDVSKEILAQCLDVRLFGVTFAKGKDSFSWAGPVQFKWGRSLHKAKVEFVQGTAAFATKETSEQRSFRNEYIVPFCFMGVYGIGNQYAAETTGASEADVEKVREGLWCGTNNLITRSKVGHKAQCLLEIVYKEGFNGAIGSLDEKVELVKMDGSSLNSDEQLALRSIKQVRISGERLLGAVKRLQDKIEKVIYIASDEFQLEQEAELKAVLGDRLQYEMR